MTFLLSLILMRWRAPLGFRIDGPIISLGGMHIFYIHSNKTIWQHQLIAMFQRIIWKCSSSAALFDSQSWWCTSFQHSFTFNGVSTSVDGHVSKDDDMKMSFRYIFVPLSVLVVCILSIFIRMQLHDNICRES